MGNPDAGEQKQARDPFANERALMVDRQIRDRGVKDQKVLKAMKKVPRHEFVPDDLIRHSYSDEPLPIGHAQTISQPYIVAFMTEMLELDGDDIALEIGTGSGYQAAVLATLVKQVYTIEIVDALGLQAKDKLKSLGYDNVEVKIGDGYNGWPEHAPFDAIIVTAAPKDIPAPLIDQLKKGGKMIIPTGGVNSAQTLRLVKKDMDGKVTIDNVLAVRFVPLTRK